MDALHTERAALLDDFGGKIDFVVRWTNTRTELHDYVGRIGAEALTHLPDCVCDDTKLGSFASGMDKTNRKCLWICDVNGATIRDVNTERDTPLIGDDAIEAGEFAAW